MPHVSKNKLDDLLYQKLFSQLIELQTGLTKTQASKMMKDLLTETEQIMLTKRCAAVLMLAHGYSAYRVWSALKLSQSTVALLRNKVEHGEYDSLIAIFKPKKSKVKDKEEFIEMFNKIMRLGMPSMGADRWKSLR